MSQLVKSNEFVPGIDKFLAPTPIQQTPPKQTPVMYIVTGMVIEQGISRGQQLLLMTENLEEAQNYKKDHEQICGVDPQSVVVLLKHTINIQNIKILQAPIIG